MKKLIFKDKEFLAEKIVKTEKSIIFYINNEEINRLQPLCTDLNEYRVYNEDGSLGQFDTMCFNENVVTTGTDLMRLLYAVLKENTNMQAEIEKLKGGVV
ncbi:hypothetical protein [Clostridium brassicae]|uniref:Peptidase S74 domain-containing protein n=1 Tax=Clostridium brassicae TaxID=2999072 RepID=A0ABT4D9J5_9CLOT|nr:hypothetical protein [Clostridium brassicae]MCY6957906.1 hypothetical protein [Clostridium brassicae]